MESLKQCQGTGAEEIGRLESLARLALHWILTSSSKSGSGHPTSALSAMEPMVDLMFGGPFRYDATRPEHPGNDRLVVSKGHASPLMYPLWASVDEVSEEELATY